MICISLEDKKTIAHTHICPITLRQAQAFVLEHHRHNAPPHGHKFSIGLSDGKQLIGVVTTSLPIAKANNNGYTLEITRCCVLDNQPNANSKLYAAAIRAARAMSYHRIITYSLPDESGSSLKAIGFCIDGMTRCNPNGWNVPSRPRKKPTRYPYGTKIRWVKEF